MRRAHIQLSNVERTSSEVQRTLERLITNTEPNKVRQIQNLEGKCIKIIINNIAGVDKNNRKLERIIETMTSKETDIFLGQEINIKTRDKTFQKFTRRTGIREYHFITSESEVPFESRKKPGGTFCITGPRMKTRIKERILDHMGRWAGCIYQLKKLQFALISVYQTVENTHHGPTSIHSQQVAILIKEGRTISPRQAFKQDLMTTIKMLQVNKIEVIIAGDFNTALISEGVIQALCLQCNLELVNNIENIGTTYRHGRSCIDHVLASSTIATKIISIEYKDYPEDYYTDHTPILLHLNIDSMINNKSLTSRQKIRRLFSKDQENSRLYIESKSKLCRHYKLQEQ